VLTDYTDTVLLENLQHNVNLNLSYSSGSKVFVKVFFSLAYLSAVLFDEGRDMFGENQLHTCLSYCRTKMRGLMWC